MTLYVCGFGQWCVFEITSLFFVCVGYGLNLAEERVCGAFGLLVCLPQRRGLRGHIEKTDCEGGTKNNSKQEQFSAILDQMAAFKLSS